MPISREELESRPVYQKLSESQKAHVRRQIYNSAIRPTFKGRGSSPESKASLIEWGMAAPVAPPPTEISSGAAGVAQGFGRYLLDDGPLGQAKQAAVRGMKAVGVPDPGYQPGVGFVANLDRQGTGKAFPTPVLAKPGSAAETGLAVGEFLGMVNPADPVNKVVIGRGLAGAAKVAAIQAPVAQKAYAAGKMAAKTGAMTAAPIAAGTAALRRSNEGKPILANGGAAEIATEGLVGGLAGAGALGLMGAAKGIGAAGTREGIARAFGRRPPEPPPAIAGLLPERTGPGAGDAIQVPPGGFRDHRVGQAGQRPEAPRGLAGFLPERTGPASMGTTVEVPPGGFRPDAMTTPFGERPPGFYEALDPPAPSLTSLMTTSQPPPGMIGRSFQRIGQAQPARMGGPIGAPDPMNPYLSATADSLPTVRQHATQGVQAAREALPVLEARFAPRSAGLPTDLGSTVPPPAGQMGLGLDLPPPPMRSNGAGAPRRPKGEAALDAADALEAKGRQILKDTQGRLLSGPGFDPDRLAGHAMVASARIIREGVSFGAWAREMVTEHGEAITTHLRRIWDDAQAIVARERPAPAAAAGAVPDAPGPTAPADPFAAKAPGAVDELAGQAPQPTGQRYAGSLNLDHIGSTRDLDGLFEAVHRVYENEVTTQRRGVVPHEVTQAIARQLGVSVESVLKMKKGETFKSAAHGLAARDLLESSAERLAGILDAYSPGTSSKEDKLRAVEAMRLHAAIQAKVSGAISETARALNAMRIDARSSAGRLRQIDEALRRAGGEGALDDVLDAAKALKGEARAAFVSKIQRKNFLSAIAEYYTASLLSAPGTWAANIIGSSISTGLKVAETLAAAGVGAATGRRGVLAGEAKAELVGMSQAWREAMEASYHTLLGKEGAGAPGATTEQYESAIPGKVGEVIRTPFRIMDSGDVFFKTLLFRAELYGRAYRKASQEGLRGPALEERMAAIVADPSPELFDAAVDASRYHTFSQALSDRRGPFRPINWLGNSVLSFKAKDPTGLSGVPVPFVRTPANLTKYSLERTPAALLSVSNWKRIAKGFSKDATPDEMADMNMTLGRVALGTMTMAYFGSLAKDGQITGNGPTDWRENKALLATGWQPLSIKVGDTYYSYARLDPLATPLALAADMATLDKFGRDKGVGDQAYAAMGSLIKNLAEKTYFSSIASLVMALKDPERYLPNYLGGMLAGFAPNLLARGAQAQDSTMRETKGETDVETTLNKVKARIPSGLGIGQDTLPEKLDPFGQPIRRDVEGIEALVSPIRRTVDKQNPALTELARLQINMPEAPDAISLEDGGPKLPLTEEQKREYHRKAGPLYEKVLTRIFDAPGYQKLGDEERVKVVRHLTGQVRDAVSQSFLAEHPDEIRATLDGYPAPSAPAPAGASR